MTLPFRRRHNDAEATHDRARELSSRRLLESLDVDDEAWLDRHLDACTECRREDEAFAADHDMLRSLRDTPIEPPRDLWAKTSAALDLAAGSARTDRSGGRGAIPWWRTLPMGAAAVAAVVLVVVGSAILPGIIGPGPQGTGQVGVGPSVVPGPTAINVDTAAILAARVGADGSLDLFSTEVNKVCPGSSPECVPPPSVHQGSTFELSFKASTVTLSPHDDQLVFESESGTTRGKVYVVPVGPAVQPSQTPSTPTASPTEGSTNPSQSPGSVEPTPIPTPLGQIEIATGVTIVGDVAYSPDGKWLAFSAAPKDGSTGPDLYLYAAGDPAATAAKAVTADHQTYFSAWLGGKVLASHIAADGEQGPGNSKASDAPGASGKGNNGQGGSIDGRASSFLFDPASGARTELGQADMWMPVVDPKGRYVVYWSGSLRSTDGVTWQLGKGDLVLDGWLDSAPAADASAAASESPTASATAGGPAGHATPIVTSHVEDFVAKFDPDGIRLAVWVSDSAGAGDGRLHLVVIDASTGTIKAEKPLDGEPALRRFSIDANRLAWVSPSGQDGQESSLRVLGWSGDTFGQIESEPTADLLILR